MHKVSRRYPESNFTESSVTHLTQGPCSRIGTSTKEDGDGESRVRNEPRERKKSCASTKTRLYRSCHGLRSTRTWTDGLEIRLTYCPSLSSSFQPNGRASTSPWRSIQDPPCSALVLNKGAVWHSPWLIIISHSARAVTSF